jgi:hypothetical protein
MTRLVLLAALLCGCALGDDDGGGSSMPSDARSGGGTPDSRTGGPIVDASSGLPDSPPYPDAGVPDAAPDAPPPVPCGTAGPETCESATDLTTMAAMAGGVTVSGDTTTLASNLSTVTACTGYSNVGPDAVYKVTANMGQTIHATLRPGPWDPSLYIVSACMADTACLLGKDEGYSGGMETLSYPVTANGTFYVVVDGWSTGSFGCYELTVRLE